MSDKRKGCGVFAWGPRRTSNWPPIWAMVGHDEYRRRTVGVGGFFGAVFFAWPHHDPACECATEPNDPYAEDDRADRWTRLDRLYQEAIRRYSDVLNGLKAYDRDEEQ